MVDRTLLLIGGGRLQLPAVRWAREAGFRVVLTDRDAEAPGRPLAHEFHVVDGTDVAGLVELARGLASGGDRLAGAWGSNDLTLPAVAAIGAATGTPAASPEALALALNKEAATARWRAAGIATTAGRALCSAAELGSALEEVGLPAVVKPVDSSGSRGVRIVRDAEQAREAFDAACELSPRVLVERRVEGLHVDVNAYFRDGAFVPAGLLDRHFTPAPRCVPVWGVQGSSLTPAQATAVYRLVEAGARALGIEVGPLKADVVWTAEGPLLLEVAPRFHGDVSTAHVSPLALGKSPIQAWFAVLAESGGPFDGMPAEPPAERAAGWMAILPESPGYLRRVSGVEDARRVPGVTDVAVLRPPGYRIAGLSDNRAVCGFLWARGLDADEVESTLERARARMTVEMETSWPSAA